MQDKTNMKAARKALAAKVGEAELTLAIAASENVKAVAEKVDGFLAKLDLAKRMELTEVRPGGIATLVSKARCGRWWESLTLEYNPDPVVKAVDGVSSERVLRLSTGAGQLLANRQSNRDLGIAIGRLSEHFDEIGSSLADCDWDGYEAARRGVDDAKAELKRFDRAVALSRLVPGARVFRSEGRESVVARLTPKFVVFDGGERFRLDAALERIVCGLWRVSGKRR